MGGKRWLLVVMAAAVVWATPHAAASPRALAGLRVEVRATYVLDPVASIVHVMQDITLTNQQADVRQGGYISQSYLDAFAVPILNGVVGVSATKSDGTPLAVRVEPENAWISAAVVDLVPNLFHPNSQSIRLTYDIPPSAPRAPSSTRINQAFATFPVFAAGDPGITSVVVQVPSDLEVEIVGDAMDETTVDGQRTFTADAIEDPDEFFASIVARDDGALVTRDVELGKHDVVIKGWPDDTAWVDFAATHVADGVPALAKLIGLPWPATSTLDVVETATPYLYGYAGWYESLASTIEVGDELDPRVMLHELSHLWFNDDLFEGRWINEAFAEEFAALALAELDAEVPAPEPIDPAAPGAVRLNDWSAPDLQSDLSEDQETYGYATSFAVLHQIAQEIGAEKLAEVVQAADAGHAAYRGPGVPEELSRTFDWKELLDLLEELGRSDVAAGLFEAYVVSAGEAAAFSARTASRASYADLVEAGAGWAPPTSVRLAMGDWRFPAADALMQKAHAVLDLRADIEGVVVGLAVDSDLALEASYEDATDLDELRTSAAEALDAAAALRHAIELEAEDRGPFEALGVALTGVDDDLAGARHAFEDGEYQRALDASATVEAKLGRAGATGLASLVAIVLLLAVAAAWYRVRSRKGV